MSELLRTDVKELMTFKASVCEI